MTTVLKVEYLFRKATLIVKLHTFLPAISFRYGDKPAIRLYCGLSSSIDMVKLESSKYIAWAEFTSFMKMRLLIFTP